MKARVPWLMVTDLAIALDDVGKLSDQGRVFVIS